MASSIVSLSDVRAHLRYPAANTADDVAIQGFINAASDVINAECGIVMPQQFDEYYNGGQQSIWLRHSPLLEVFQVEEGWGFLDYVLVQVAVNTVPANSMFAYSVDDAATSCLTRRVAGNVAISFVPGTANIHVTYSAGRAAVPAAIRLACLELVAHWWQNSQQRHGSTGGGADSYDTVNVDYSRALAETSINQGVPYRILELLKPFRRMPIIG